MSSHQPPLFLLRYHQSKQSGFHRVGNCCSGAGIQLQYGNHPIWVNAFSTSPGYLQLSFEQLHGGCSNIPEVAGAKDVMTQVRTNLESQFGAALVEAHAANRSSQP